MQKQKICIIGGSLTGLVTAIALSKLNCDIDLITNSSITNSSNNRTTAISHSNLKFLETLNISISLKKYTWPCSQIKLYTKNNDNNFSEVFELNKKEKNKEVFYMVENSKLLRLMINKIKKIESISINKNHTISEITDSGLLKEVRFKNKNYKYNLVIICTGSNSNLVKKIFKDKIIGGSYEESSLTSVISHASLNNKTARQFFFKNEILALLPISNNKTSAVLVAKNFDSKSDLFFKKKVNEYSKNYLKKINFLNKIEHKNLTFLIRNKYSNDRVLLFGDALHVIHPFVGQGFNMVLRDLVTLEKILKNNINLGLDIGSSNVLSDFSKEVKPRNFIFSASVNILKNSLTNKKIRENSLKMLNKSNLAKNIFFNIANKGFQF